MRQVNFHALRREVRRRYRERPVWMLLDEAPCHVAAKSEAVRVLRYRHNQDKARSAD